MIDLLGDHKSIGAMTVVVQSIQEEETWNEGAIYLSLLAASTFQDLHGRKPGETATMRDSSWELDIQQLQQISTAIWHELGFQAKCVVTQELLTEVCRCAGSSMHCVGAIVGGIAAQEAIKLLLRQFVPVRGVLVYDGVRASSRVLHV
jgi:NEDD8-activating enzyme E1 regulatory subunit